MSEFDRDDPDDDPAAPWNVRRNARQSVRQMVHGMVETDLWRRHMIDRETQERHRLSWLKLHERFDPPQDDASLSARLHVPYTSQPEPAVQSMAVDDEEEGDDGPPPEQQENDG